MRSRAARVRTSSTLRNPDYWQSKPGHPVPLIKEIDYPAFLSNTPANLALSQGQAQWGGQYIPNVQGFYVAKDPAHRHIWYPPVLNVALVPNLDNPLLGKLPVRQAIADALNRPAIARLGEGGEQQPANQTGVITPTFQSWSDSSLTGSTYSPSKAEQILELRRLQEGLGRDLQVAERTAALVHDQDDQRLLGLGLVAPDHHAAAEGGRDLGDRSG